MSYQKYLSSHTSNIEWLGEIPIHWTTKKLKHLAIIQTGTTPSKSIDSNYSEFGLPWVKPDDLGKFIPIIDSREKLSGDGKLVARIIPANSVLVCCIGSIGKMGIAGCELATNQQINALIFNAGINYLYGAYTTFAASNEHERLANGNVVKIINTEIQGNIRFPYPPFDEQTAIANFLDHETAKIDTLIAKQQRLIELLQEKRQALISHAVTKGLNPDAPMKESEIEWIGEVPIHWEVYALGKVSRLQRGHDLPDSLRIEGPYPIVTSSGVSAFHSEFKAHAPGVVTGRYGTIGKMYYIEEDYWPLNTALYVIDFFGNHPKFIYYMLMTLPFDMHSDKSAVPGVNRNDLHRLAVTVPPLEEQIGIAEFIDHALRQLDKLVDKATKVIDILQERRSSLISAAVTGKIDVRGYNITPESSYEPKT